MGFMLAIIVFLLFLLLLLGKHTEGFEPRCPNLLIQHGSEIWLKNTSLAEVPGVNPIVFKNLDEYTEFISWQRSRKIDCPVLYLQKSFDAQGAAKFTAKTPPEHKLIDASRDQPPYNYNSYPGVDAMNQSIGQNTPLDEYHTIGEKQPMSADAMDANWGGASYTAAAVKGGNYSGDEVYKYK